MPEFPVVLSEKLPQCSKFLPGMAPGIVRRGADSSDEGAKYGFQGTINAKNL